MASKKNDMNIDDIINGKYNNVTNVIQIKNATHAYIMHVDNNNGSETDKYYIYTQSGNDTLDILWYGHLKDDYENENMYLLPCQYTQNRNTNKAYIEFRLKGCNYSKTGDIASMLIAINPDIKVFTISGCYPSSVSANARY